jgi:signal transduction histidine kinase
MRNTAHAALLEKIEELSFLRCLNERMAGVPDFASACRALVDSVWEERRPAAVAYLSVDGERGVCRVEAVAPATACVAGGDLSLDASPLPELLSRAEPLIVREVPAWLGVATPGGVLVSAPTVVRGRVTGLLVFLYDRGDVGTLEEDRRLLAIVATSAAAALDVARNEEREEFLATLRHDINNPVAVALGYTEMMVDGLRARGDEEALGLAARVLESLRVVEDLVSNHLHMAAIDRGTPWLATQTFDLRALVDEVVGRLAPSATARGLTLVARGPGVRLHADRRQLGRVVANLVGNALKYTPAPGRIEVRVATEGASAVLVVEDTGHGIAAADLPRLFTKYARFHRDLPIPGTGLGLYITKAIVEAHGGTVAATSTPGCGSTFTAVLPTRATARVGGEPRESGVLDTCGGRAAAGGAGAAGLPETDGTEADGST